MHLDAYPFEMSVSSHEFEFYSDGPKGKIRKRITFDMANNNIKLYNLGFGDVSVLGEMDDEIVSDNNDSKKIFLTVAQAVNMFFENNPDCSVYAIGNTDSRTRLYRMKISAGLSMITINYEVFGFAGYQWELFKKNKNYEAFLIKRKHNNFKL